MTLTNAKLVPPDEIRTLFARALSDMYRAEVPAYGELLDLVRRINGEVLSRDEALRERLVRTGDLGRLDEERHGAIRVGTAAELALVARAFAVMGMVPVGYYNLAPAGVPVHSTAFRPIDAAALARNPFRIFTSLLRLELIEDTELRAAAAAILARRQIVTPEALALIEFAEAQGGLDQEQAARFVPALLETFRWHAEATVNHETYESLVAAHRLIADVVSFRGPHINHLTPRTLDIDAVQAGMSLYGITPKAVIEGPPRRDCAVLLRQTSFTALEEPISFASSFGMLPGTHTARFGEIEQRGAALTPAGLALYDRLLAGRGQGDSWFDEFPDDWGEMRRSKLAWFEYRALSDVRGLGGMDDANLEALIAAGKVEARPITYEDFLPVSAAGIFQSNLGAESREGYGAGAAKVEFEAALGRTVEDPMMLYAAQQQRSLKHLRGLLAEPGAPVLETC